MLLKFIIVQILIFPLVSIEWALYNNRAVTCRQLSNIQMEPLSLVGLNQPVLTSSQGFGPKPASSADCADYHVVPF